MPRIKTKRTDIIRQREALDTIKNSEPWLACIVALAWIFGKRIAEILKVTKEDIRTDDKFLWVRFHVGKKKTRAAEPVPRPFLKRITLKHPGVPYILNYIADKPDGPLFTVSQQSARYYLKKVNPKVYFHLFRHSLATEMAEHEATEDELMDWFDWDRADTAHGYVRRGPRLTRRLSERTW